MKIKKEIEEFFIVTFILILALIYSFMNEAFEWILVTVLNGRYFYNIIMYFLLTLILYRLYIIIKSIQLTHACFNVLDKRLRKIENRLEDIEE